MWSSKFSWSLMMTSRFPADFVRTISEDPKLMLCCIEGLAGKMIETQLNMCFSHSLLGCPIQRMQTGGAGNFQCEVGLGQRTGA